MTSINEKAAQIFEHLCNHDWHGYTQGARWGDGEGVCEIWIDDEPYYVEQGDRDCSSAIISAYQAAGLDVDATYTGNMRAGFLDTGLFSWESMDFWASRGDIYLNEGCHTAMCLDGGSDGVYGYDCLGEFSISETGGIYGETGDQTGWESHICGYYDYPWDGILHWIGGDYDGGSGGSDYDPGESGSGYDVDEIAWQVINGEWGNGDYRRDRLTECGYDYDAVQSRVNELLATPSYNVDDIAREVIMGYWGNGDDRVRRLEDAGYDYWQVQNRVNEMLA